MSYLVPAAGLILMGDSITSGTIGSVGGGGTPYATLLAARYAIENRGIGASTSGDWAANPLNTVNPSRKPVVVMLGTVDASGFGHPGPTDPADYLTNMDTLVTRAIADGAPYVVVMTPPPRGEGDASASELDRLAAYRSAIFALCDDFPSVAARLGPDVNQLLSPVEDFVPADGTHPNAAGHAKIASALFEIFQLLPFGVVEANGSFGPAVSAGSAFESAARGSASLSKVI